MWFFFSSGSRVAQRKLDDGTFPCPFCKSRQPCVRVNVEREQTVYGISVGAGHLLAELIQCSTCHRSFRAELFASKDDQKNMDVKLWECPKCKGQNPNSTYRCQHCQYSLV